MKILIPVKNSDETPAKAGEYLTNAMGYVELYFDGENWRDYEGGAILKMDEFTPGFRWYKSQNIEKVMVEFGNYLFSTLGNRNINEVTHADLENFKHAQNSPTSNTVQN